MSSSACPKCQGPRDAKALYCPFCGVVFARYIENSLPAAAPPAAPKAEAPPLFRPKQTFAEAPVSVFADSAPAEPAAAAPVGETVWREGQRLRGGTETFDPSPRQISSSFFANGGPASPWSRLVAQILNSLGFGLYVFGSAMVVAVLASFLLDTTIHDDRVRTYAGAGVVLGGFYWVVSNLSQLASTGQSLGKKWMGIRIVRSNGEEASLIRLVFARWLPTYALGAIPLLGLIDSIFVLLPERRALHDRIADTAVVRC